MARLTHRIQLVLALSLLALVQAAPAGAQTPLFEVEKNDGTKLLQVHDDAGFVVRGTLNAGSIPATGSGTRLMWYPGKGAFRSGTVDATQWDDGNVGRGSAAWGSNTVASGSLSNAMGSGSAATAELATAMGNATTASGQVSTAMGSNTTASGNYSTAMGFHSIASGLHSTAMGNFATASGETSAAMGNATIASGESSTAMGYASVASGNFSIAAGFGAQATAERAVAMGQNTIASGIASVALGSYVTAGPGSFIFGDFSTNQVQSTGSNQFLVRAYGGIGFNSAPNIGCDLNPGSGAWACTSSRLAKEGFEDVDGETVLRKLAGIRIQRWRYIGTTALHVGPTAEDFRSAFGLGETSIKIGTVDAEGIALRAVQALERRTAELRSENVELRADLAALRSELAALRNGLRAPAESQP